MILDKYSNHIWYYVISGNHIGRETNMAKFKLEIIETLSRIVEVDAETIEEAYEKLDNDYLNEVIVLDAEDYAEYEIRHW